MLKFNPFNSRHHTKCIAFQAYVVSCRSKFILYKNRIQANQQTNWPFHMLQVSYVRMFLFPYKLCNISNLLQITVHREERNKSYIFVMLFTSVLLWIWYIIWVVCLIIFLVSGWITIFIPQLRFESIHKGIDQPPTSFRCVYISVSVCPSHYERCMPSVREIVVVGLANAPCSCALCAICPLISSYCVEEVVYF